MAIRPKLTDKVLKELTTLVIVNERFRNMEKQDPQNFRDNGEYLQRKYNAEIKPILAPFAAHYSTIKTQMELREEIYKRQISPS